MPDDTIDNAFEFMIKEYEMIYSHFKQHDDAVERSFRLFLVVFGVSASMLGFVVKEDGTQRINVLALDAFALLVVALTASFGLVMVLKIGEHRLLMIDYVKALNLNRRWFVETLATGENMLKFMYWEPQIKFPPYFSWFNHFFWEMTAMSFFVGSLFSLLIANIYFLLRCIRSPDFHLVTGIFLALLALAISAFLVLIYYGRAMYRERQLVKYRGRELFTVNQSISREIKSKAEE